MSRHIFRFFSRKSCPDDDSTGSRLFFIIFLLLGTFLYYFLYLDLHTLGVFLSFKVFTERLLQLRQKFI